MENHKKDSNNSLNVAQRVMITLQNVDKVLKDHTPRQCSQKEKNTINLAHFHLGEEKKHKAPRRGAALQSKFVATAL